MSKKKKVKKIKREVKENTKSFSVIQETVIRSLIIQQTFNLEQGMKVLLREFEILKANVITSNSLLEEKKIINEKEFFAKFEEVQKQTAAQEGGNVGGRVIYTIYNDNIFKEKGESK